MMSESEYWAALGIFAVLVFAGFKLVVMMIYPENRKYDDTPYGDTGGWPKKD